MLKYTIYIAIAAAIILSAGNLFVFGLNRRPIYKEASRASEIAFWERFSQENPTYRDAHLVLARLLYEEGRVEESQQALAEFHSSLP